MFINYLKIMVRMLSKQKIISSINVLGLSIGLAAGFTMILYSIHEIGFDKYNKNLENIYLVKNTSKDFNWIELEAPRPLAQAVKAELPEIKTAARSANIRGTIKIKDNTFNVNQAKSVDPEIFDILSLTLKSGKRETIFKERNSAVICETLAQKCFGISNPLGQIISFETSTGSYDLVITGIIENITNTSTFQADLIVPLFISEDKLTSSWGKRYNNPLDSWDLSYYSTYILLQSGTDISAFTNKFATVIGKNLNPASHIEFSIFPLKDLYFHSSEMVNNRFPQGNLTNVYIYSTAALLLLFIACLNFVILSTSTANLRIKEIGVRKVLGAGRQNIIKQIILESLSVSILAIPAAVLLLELFLPKISNLLGTELSREYFHNWMFIILFLLITILVGVASGSYIAFYLSKFNPVNILHNKFNIGKNRVLFRQTLIGIQMVVFIGLIFISITIYQQLRFLYNKDFGFNKDELVVLYGEDSSLRNNFDAFKNELKNNPNIINVSGANMIPGTDSKMVIIAPRKDDPTKRISLEGTNVDGDFIRTLHMTIVSGRDFSSSYQNGSNREYILNETAVKELGLKNPIGEKIMEGEVIGVVKDFNFHSLHESIQPMFLSRGTKYLSEIIVKINKTDIPGTIQYIKEKSKLFNNGSPMEFEFFDERLAKLYVEDENFGEVIGYFTLLSIFVACLGLFGMSLFAVQQRIKEIGIRKVLGASYLDIVIIISKEFISLVGIASIIAVPIAIYLISTWLQNFAYRINIDLWLIISTVFIALIITFVSVGFKALHAASANPVESLRYE